MAFKKEEAKKEEYPVYILKDISKNRVWHEQFSSRAQAQAKIDYERKEHGLNGNWVIDVIYPKKNNDGEN